MSLYNLICLTTNINTNFNHKHNKIISINIRVTIRSAKLYFPNAKYLIYNDHYFLNTTGMYQHRYHGDDFRNTV